MTYAVLPNITMCKESVTLAVYPESMEYDENVDYKVRMEIATN